MSCVSWITKSLHTQGALNPFKDPSPSKWCLEGPLVVGLGSLSSLLALVNLMSHCPAPLWSSLRSLHPSVSLDSGGSLRVPVMTWTALQLPFRCLIYALGEKKRWSSALNKEAVKTGKPVCFLIMTISFKKWKNERLILKFISHCRRKFSLGRQSFQWQHSVGCSLPHWPRSACAGWACAQGARTRAWPQWVTGFSKRQENFHAKS